MSTLYRKYRPQKFADLADQEYILRTIGNEISTNKIAHAYLFSGPRGVGKTTMARLLAKAVNCVNRKDSETEPCNECSACKDITAGRHIDVIEIDAASQTGVDNVRENIIENSQFKPTSAKYKVFIIDEVHMLSNSAFNALLKTLEEPPAHIIFILATTELHKLPATVVSRCQRFFFKKISLTNTLERLDKICQEEKIKVDKEVLERIALKSDGGLRDAESLLGQLFSLNLKKISIEEAELILPSSDTGAVVNFVSKLVTKNTSEAITIIQNQVESGSNLDQFMLDIIDVLRVALINKVAGHQEMMMANYNENLQKEIKKISTDVSAHELTKMIDLVLKRRLEIKTAPVPQLPIELLVVEITDNFIEVPKINTTPPPTPTTTVSVQPTTKASPTPIVPTITNTIIKATNELPAKTEVVEKSASLVETFKNAVGHIINDTPIKITFEEICKRWNEFTTKLNTTNPSLTIMIKAGKLCSLNGKRLVLQVPFSLHKEKIEEAKNKKAIEETLEFVFKEKIVLICEIQPAKIVVPDVDLSNLAVAFGGEIVG